MKRSSSCLILLALMPGIVQAWGYTPSYCRVRYSPYALRYGSSGLVQGRLDYSLHAFDYDGSALVYWDTRYTPYTTSYDNSGLIADCHSTRGPSYSYLHPAYFHSYTLCAKPIRAHPVRPSARKAYSSARPSTPSYSVAAREATEEQTDGLDIIRRHLKAKGIGALGVNRILRIEDTLVSVDVIVRDRDVLIKYWNADAIEQLDAKEAFKQCAYEKYRQDWEGFAATYRRNGGEIYSITASDAQTIVALLDCCTRLAPERDKPAATSMYARN